MDERSGFNLLQAAVFEEKYNIVLEASGLFNNFVEEMELTKTGKNAKEFIGKTAVDFLSLRKRTRFMLISKGFMKSWLRTAAD